MIEARQIVFAYGRREILGGVSLRVERGEFVCLVGRNGSGKSTLLRILSGELRCRGEVLYDGASAHSLGPHELARRRAVLSQNADLAFPFPVSEVVAMGRAPFKAEPPATRERIVSEALTAVGLSDFRDRVYTALSGGERQRVQLARVLAQAWPEPGHAGGFILLDEPTSALDLAHVFGALSVVRSLCGRAIGALAVLHDLNAAALHADRVVVLDRGEIVACGPPRDALQPAVLERHFGIRAEISPSGAITPIAPVDPAHQPQEPR